MAQASTKLSNRILIFGPKNFWRASECNRAAWLHSDARQKFFRPFPEKKYYFSGKGPKKIEKAKNRKIGFPHFLAFLILLILSFGWDKSDEKWRTTYIWREKIFKK